MQDSRKAFSTNLDLLRSAAVACVFFSHLRGVTVGDDFGGLGRVGVVIFFVHTSTVLMASLHRLEADHPRTFTLFSAFWIKRIFRIYPLAILAVLIVVTLHIPLVLGLPYSWIGAKGFLSNLLLIQNLNGSENVLGPMWSLPIEVQMYAILPFAYLAIRGNRRYRSLALWVLSLLLAITVPRINWRLGVFAFAPCFTSGILAYDLIRSRHSTWTFPAWVWPLTVLASVFLFGSHDNIDLGHKMHRAWAVSLFLGTMYAVTADAHPNWTHSIFHWIAERSYGIYLSHMMIFWLVLYEMNGLPRWIRAVTLVAGSLGLPALMYVGVEKPFVLAGNHVARHLLRHPLVMRIRRAA